MHSLDFKILNTLWKGIYNFKFELLWKLCRLETILKKLQISIGPDNKESKIMSFHFLRKQIFSLKNSHLYY